MCVIAYTVNPVGMAGRATTQNDVRQLVGKDCIPLRGKNQTCCLVPLNQAWSGRVVYSQVLCVRLSWMQVVPI